MSTIHYDVTEWATLIAACVPAYYAPDDAEEACKGMAKDVATLSVANTRAFNANYREDASPCTAEELTKAAINARRMRVPKTANAVSTLGRLAYNCHYDKDFLASAEGGLQAHVNVSSALMNAIRSEQR